MDDFGLGAGAIGALDAVRRAQRASGRTTRLIERFEEGDCIVFLRLEHARDAERKARSMGKEIKWRVMKSLNPKDVHQHLGGSLQGRLHFDHVWLEEFYGSALRFAVEDVRRAQDNASGFGEPHRQTRDAAREIARFI